jgi:peroxiredoxin Q/BCP
MEPTEGAQAPEIELQTDSCETFRLSDHRGKKVILYFYPRASTPGCTTEACEFRDTHKQIGKHDSIIVGISPDTTAAQARFKKAQNLPFTLLADVEKKAAQDYGVWKEKNMYGKKVWGVERTTFLIDENGKIAKIFRKVKPKGHAAEVLQNL